MKRLVSCQYCGNIHERNYICEEKEIVLNKRQSKLSSSVKDKFRWSKQWKFKRNLIRKRDFTIVSDMHQKSL